MTLVRSTRCTWAQHEGLPELPAGEDIDVPEALLHIALGLPGVIQLPPPVPRTGNGASPDLPETAWERQAVHEPRE